VSFNHGEDRVQVFTPRSCRNADGEVKDNMVFCADILDALTQDFFARKGNPIEEPPHVDEVKVRLRESIPYEDSIASCMSMALASFGRRDEEENFAGGVIYALQARPTVQGNLAMPDDDNDGKQVDGADFGGDGKGVHCIHANGEGTFRNRMSKDATE